MARITVIRLSLQTFVCGLVGLLPVIGLVPGLLALSGWARVRIRYRKEWNPASAYLDWGACLALLGLALTAFTVFLAIAGYIASLYD